MCDLGAISFNGTKLVVMFANNERVEVFQFNTRQELENEVKRWANKPDHEKPRLASN